MQAITYVYIHAKGCWHNGNSPLGSILNQIIQFMGGILKKIIHFMGDTSNQKIYFMSDTLNKITHFMDDILKHIIPFFNSTCNFQPFPIPIIHSFVLQFNYP